MRVAFLYNEASEDPAHLSDEPNPAEGPVVAALRRRGHDVTPVAATLDLAATRQRLFEARPQVVFNRVDSLGGSDRMMAAAALLVETMSIPYTGCPAAVLVALSSKLAVKERLLETGLPTPGWITVDGAVSPTSDQPFIVKSVFEHASFGLGDGAIVEGTVGDVRRVIREREQQQRRPYFAEQYVEGRELNLSLWEGRPRGLPVAEIDFSAFPPGRPRIVGQRAKWDPASVEYQATPRTFDLPPADRPLVDRLESLAAACWQTFGLRGYARVDFRVDRLGQPWILEMNANPCLSPTSGFAAALAQAGVGYDAGIEQILLAAADVPGRLMGHASPESSPHRQPLPAPTGG